LADARSEGEGSDCRLLERFTAQGEEAAFALLMKRHGPMVLGVCRRVVGHLQDAEDAFQATFLLLAQKAATIRRKESVASWLHGVAYRLAWKARRGMTRRREHERRAPRPEPTNAVCQELQAELDNALRGLPEKYRAALLLCYFEGRTVEEAARTLGCPRGTVASRLSQGRELLRRRLARSGLVLSTGALTTFLLTGAPSTVVAAPLVHATFREAARIAAGKAAEVSSPVAALLLSGARGMTLGKVKAIAFVLLSVSGIAAAAGVLLQERGNPVELGAVAPFAADPKPVVEEKPRVDMTGDPLPEGALARIGTLRFRSSDDDHLSFLAFPDSKLLVTQEMRGLRVWETRTGKHLRRIPDKPEDMPGGKYYVYSSDLSPDGQTAAILAVPDGVVLWDVTTGKKVRDVARVPFAPNTVRFSPDGKSLLTMGRDSAITLFDLVTDLPLWKTQTGTRGLSAAEFSADGKTLVISCPDKTVRVLNGATGEQRRSIETQNTLTKISLSKDGQFLAAIDRSKPVQNVWFGDLIRIWNVDSGKELRQISVSGGENRAGADGGFSSLLFTPDGKSLLSAGPDRFVRVWDHVTGKELRRIDCTHTPHGLACTRDGSMLATTVGVMTIRLFDLRTGKDLAPTEGHQLAVGDVALSGDGRHLAVLGDYKSIEFWDPLSGRLHSRREEGKGTMFLFPAPDGRTVFAVSGGKLVHAYDISTGKELRRFPLGTPTQRARLAVSPDCKTLALTSYYARAFSLLDANTGKEIKKLPGGPGIQDGAFVEGGQKLLVWTGDHEAHLWDLVTGKKVLEFPFPYDRGPRQPGPSNKGLSYNAAVSPDGRLIAYGSQFNYLVLMETTTGREIASVTNLPAGVWAIGFAPDTRTIAWGGMRDPAIRLLEIATGKERRCLMGHRGAALALSFSADGNILVSGSQDSTALVWEVSGPSGAAARLTAAELDACWQDLAGADAARAYRAVRRLARDAAQSVPFLDRRLQPVPDVDEKHLSRLIAALDSKTFAVREQAGRELDCLGELAGPALRQALKGDIPIEVRRRAQRLLDKERQRQQNPPADLLQALRALEVLEAIGNAEAVKVLDRIGRGATRARLTLDAKASVERVTYRSSWERAKANLTPRRR
jgi:RNA polymerase sigma factor (sigma-70 family)